MSRHHSRAIQRLLPLLVLIGLAAGAQLASAGPYREGEFIEITGTVADPTGMPIPDIQVKFRATRQVFSPTRFRKTIRDEVEETVAADPLGQFTFRWRWLDYYNRFEIVVGVPKRSAAGQTFEVLSQLDLSKRIGKGSPVVVAMTVEDDDFLDGLRDFLASVDSEDEERIYEEMGTPDRVQRIENPDGDEISWWYFRVGKAFRFIDGELQQVVHFDAVTPFDT